MWTWLNTNFSVRLEAANSAVEETGWLCIQFAAQFAETFQCQYFFGIDVHTVGFQQRGQSVGVGRVESHMDVINTEAQLVAKHTGGANICRNHGFFHDTVCDAAWLSDDVQYFTFFTENETVIRAIFKDQRVVMTPLSSAQANTMQQTDLFRNRVVFWLPLASTFQPVGNIVIGQLRFRLDGCGEEGDVVFNRAIGGNAHTTS